MKVCEYYLRGCCRFGSRCRNHHPPLSNQRQGVSAQDERLATIAKDLNSDRPPWPFSAYGLDNEPSIFSDIEVSPEELRWLYKCAPDVYRSECQRLLKQAHHHWYNDPPDLPPPPAAHPTPPHLRLPTTTPPPPPPPPFTSPVGVPIDIDPCPPLSPPHTTSLSPPPPPPPLPPWMAGDPQPTHTTLLSEDERSAFAAPQFEFGRIPESEPPVEFR